MATSAPKRRAAGHGTFSRRDFERAASRREAWGLATGKELVAGWRSGFEDAAAAVLRRARRMPVCLVPAPRGTEPRLPANWRFPLNPIGLIGIISGAMTMSCRLDQFPCLRCTLAACRHLRNDLAKGYNDLAKG